jgi:hypothetical protein
MHKDIRDAILLQMYKTYQVKHSDDDSYVDSYIFSFLYIHLNEAINHLTQPHGTQSPILLDELAVGGYLRKDKCNYYLTKKTLEHLMDRRKTTIQTTPDTTNHTHTNTHWQNNKFKYIVVGCIIAIVGTVSGGIILHEIYPPK